MKNKMKFTFKTEKPTGRYRSFAPKTHYVKLKRKQVGGISDNYPYRIWLSIKKEVTKEFPAPFRNVYLKKQFASVEEAKEYLNENISRILELGLYSHDN
jgi:hypothetical protein